MTGELGPVDEFVQAVGVAHAQPFTAYTPGSRFALLETGDYPLHDPETLDIIYQAYRRGLWIYLAEADLSVSPIEEEEYEVDPDIAIFADFIEWWMACLQELKRHWPEKARSYDDDVWQMPAGEMPAVHCFKEIFIGAYEKWAETDDPSQLVDVSNIAGMLWRLESPNSRRAKK